MLYMTNSNAIKSIIKQAWTTEKAGDLTRAKKYIFIVDKKTNKPEVKKAVESIYKVKVDSVNIVNAKEKPRRLGRTMGKVAGFKKAIITLKEGKIDVMPT